jgi:hypothetical protein
MKFVLLPSAREDLVEIRQYIQQHRATAHRSSDRRRRSVGMAYSWVTLFITISDYR